MFRGPDARLGASPQYVHMASFGWNPIGSAPFNRAFAEFTLAPKICRFTAWRPKKVKPTEAPSPHMPNITKLNPMKSILLICCVVLFQLNVRARPHEVWLFDQSGTRPDGGGGTLYIYDGAELQGDRIELRVDEHRKRVGKSA